VSGNAYLDYLQHKQAGQTMKSILLLSEGLTPELERTIDDITAGLGFLQDDPLVDLAVATSLCINLVERLKRLAEKGNDFDLREDNMEKFAFGLLKSIFNSR